MNVKEFFRRWRKGIKELSPGAQLRAKRTGLIGTIIGIIFGSSFLIANGLWYWSPMLFFVLILQSVELIGTNQQIEHVRDISDQLKLQHEEEGK